MVLCSVALLFKDGNPGSSQQCCLVLPVVGRVGNEVGRLEDKLPTSAVYLTERFGQPY